MNVVIFNEAGEATSIMSTGNIADIEMTLAMSAQYWGLHSRILDGTPHNDSLCLAAIPNLGTFDADVIAAGGTPAPYEPPSATSPGTQ